MRVSMRWLLPALLLPFTVLCALAQVKPTPADWTIYITNDSCSDYTWGFNEEPTRRADADVVRAHLDEMNRTDSLAPADRDRYNLSISQEALMFLHYYPERKAEFLRRVREGRIYIGPFLNNNLWAFQGTESLIRSMYPARRLERETGVPMKIGVHIEEPALPWGAASILASSGIESLLVHFLDYDSHFSALTNPPVFAWAGADGQSIRVWMDDWPAEKANYVQGAYLLNKPELIEKEWLPHYSQLGADYPARIILAAGTHGDNGPKKWELARGFADSIIHYNAQPGPHAHLVNATLPQVFAALDQAIEPGWKPPVLRGDFGHVWDVWPLTLAKYAAAARAGGRAFLAAESLIAAASQLDPGLIERTRAARDRAEWDWTMLADHAWNGADDANRRENARLRREWSADLTTLDADLETHAWKALNLSADPHSLTLFNSLGAPRGGLVRVDVPQDVDAAFDGARALPAQVVTEDGHRRLYFAAPQITGFGFAAVRLGRIPSNAQPRTLRASAWELESARYRLMIDSKTGGVASLFDKILIRELVAPGSRTLGQTVFFDGREHSATDVHSEVDELGLVLARVKVTSTIDEIRLTTFITLYADLDRIDFDFRIHKPVTTVEQRLTHVFPVLAPGAVERIETTGAVLRPSLSPVGDLLPGADPNRFAVQGFIDASLPQGPGVTIAPLEAFALRRDLDGLSFEALGNDQNYKESGHDQNGETDFRFSYSLRSHAAAFDQADAVAWSRAAATPLLAAAGRLRGALIPGVEIDPRRAIVTAWKAADGDGLILRLWETAGETAPLVVRLHGFKSAVATDLLERDLHALPVTSGQVSVDLRAHGFAAIRLLR